MPHDGNTAIYALDSPSRLNLEIGLARDMRGTPMSPRDPPTRGTQSGRSTPMASSRELRVPPPTPLGTPNSAPLTPPPRLSPLALPSPPTQPYTAPPQPAYSTKYQPPPRILPPPASAGGRQDAGAPPSFSDRPDQPGDMQVLVQQRGVFPRWADTRQPLLCPSLVPQPRPQPSPGDDSAASPSEPNADVEHRSSMRQHPARKGSGFAKADSSPPFGRQQRHVPFAESANGAMSLHSSGSSSLSWANNVSPASRASPQRGTARTMPDGVPQLIVADLGLAGAPPLAASPPQGAKSLGALSFIADGHVHPCLSEKELLALSESTPRVVLQRFVVPVMLEIDVSGGGGDDDGYQRSASMPVAAHYVRLQGSLTLPSGKKQVPKHLPTKVVVYAHMCLEFHTQMHATLFAYV